MAFSFLSRDETLATRLNELVKDRLSTFLYSEKQKQLAGKDGEALFNAVFGVESRLVVVLYRPGWGETSFTRIEETAIRNRGYSEGYEFTLVVVLESDAPPWLPKNRLWLNLERFGESAAAAVIEERVTERGALVRPETAEENAWRLGRELASEKSGSCFSCKKDLNEPRQR